MEALDNKLKNEIMRDTLKPIDDYIKKLPEKLTKEVKDQLKPLDLRIDAIIESEFNIEKLRAGLHLGVQTLVRAGNNEG